MKHNDVVEAWLPEYTLMNVLSFDKVLLKGPSFETCYPSVENGYKYQDLYHYYAKKINELSCYNILLVSISLVFRN